MPSRRRRIRQAAIVAEFAQRMRSIRISRDMTQRELASRANVALSYISRLEAGGAAPGIDLLERLANALSVNPADLLPPPLATELTNQRELSRTLFEAVSAKAGPESISMLVLLLQRLTNSPGLST
jgi:transcriptional regulator with XRE-family HTH domain